MVDSPQYIGYKWSGVLRRPSSDASLSSTKGAPVNRERRSPATPSITFRFPISWSCLSEPAVREGVARDAWLSRQSSESASTATAPRVAPPLDVSAPSKRLGVRESPVPEQSAAQWEMVIPKMPRPVAKAAPPPLPQASRPELPEPARVEFQGPVSESRTSATEPLFNTGSLLSGQPSSRTRLKRLVSRGWNAIPAAWRLGAAAAVVTGASVIVWQRPDPPRTTASVPEQAPAGTWVHERASFVSAEPRPERQLLLFRTSQNETNSSLEFDWKADPKGAGWIFRNSGNSNYYAGHIALLSYEPTPTLVVEHFAVIAGAESEHVRKLVPYSGNPSPLRVRMEVSEAAFTLFVENKSVDYWIDRRLGSGDSGFYQERGENPSIGFVQLSLLKPPAPGYAGPFHSLPGSAP